MLTRLGQRHAPGRAGEQHHAQLVLQLLDRLAHCGTRHAELAGSPAETSVMSHREECLELGERRGGHGRPGTNIVQQILTGCSILKQTYTIGPTACASRTGDRTLDCKALLNRLSGGSVLPNCRRWRNAPAARESP